MLQSFQCSFGQVRRWHHGQNGVFFLFSCVASTKAVVAEFFMPTTHSVRKWAVGEWAARPGGGTRALASSSCCSSTR